MMTGGAERCTTCGGPLGAAYFVFGAEAFCSIECQRQGGERMRAAGEKPDPAHAGRSEDHVADGGDGAGPPSSPSMPDPRSDFADLTITERQSALDAFRAICNLVEHDSRAYCIASAEASWLAASREDAAKGLDDHALAGMFEYLASAIDRGASPVADEDVSRNVREARNRARWLRERAERGTASASADARVEARRFLGNTYPTPEAAEDALTVIIDFAAARDRASDPSSVPQKRTTP